MFSESDLFFCCIYYIILLSGRANENKREESVEISSAVTPEIFA